MKPKPNTVFLVGFALALLGGVAWFNWRHTTRMKESAELVRHTHEVLQQLTGLLSKAQDIETGARGFVLTGDPAFLNPFETALGEVNAQFRALRALTSDNPRQQANCDSLEPLITRRIALAQANVDLRRDSGFEAAQQEIASGKGKAVMEQVRAVIARMDAEEQALLVQRSAVATREAGLTKLLTAVGTSLSVALLIGVFALVLRENRLRQRSEAELDRFFTLSLDMLCIASADGYLKRISPAFTRTLGWSAEEILARPFLEFVHPDDRAATLREVDRQIIARENVLEFENRYRHKDGSWRVLSWKSVPQPGGLMYATARDMTGKKEVEMILRERTRLAEFQAHIGHAVTNNSALRPLLQECAEAIVKTFDAAFARIWTLNESAQMLELQASAGLYTHLDGPHGRVPVGKFKIGLIAQERKPHLTNQVVGDPRVGDQEWARREGMVAFAGYPLVVEGRVIGVIAMFARHPFLDLDLQAVASVANSISLAIESKKAEEQIIKLNTDLHQRAAQLEEANKELASFSYSVSHDLRSPLRGIDGFSQALEEDYGDKLDEAGRGYLARVRAATHRMGDLIDDLLKLSRITRAELRHEPVDLSALARTVAGALQLREPQRQVQWEIAGGLSAEGDPQLLRVALENLLGNAWKFTGKQPDARIEFGRWQSDGQTAFYVRDNGAGFDMTHANRLFGAFQRLHTVAEFEGTGIGLATVQRIVLRHGGRLWAEGAVDKGAVFYFTLRPTNP